MNDQDSSALQAVLSEAQAASSAAQPGKKPSWWSFLWAATHLMPGACPRMAPTSTHIWIARTEQD